MKRAGFALLLVLVMLAASAALADFSLPADTRRVEADAFRSDRKLTGVLHVPDGCSSIGDYAFYGTGICGAALPDTITEIGAHAFSGDHLIWVRIDAANVQLGEEALYDVPVIIAPANNSFYQPGSKPYDTGFCPIDELYASEGFYYQIHTDGTATLLCPIDPSQIASSITLPERVNGAVLTGMSRHAFRGCSHLREIHVTGAQTAVNNLALYECTRATVIRPQVHEIELVSVPDTVDLYLNRGGEAYDLPKAKVQLLNGAAIESVRAEGLEQVNMTVQISDPDESSVVEVGLWGPYLPAEKKTGDHTVSIVLSTAHDSLTVPIALNLHSERVRTVHYDWDASSTAQTYAPNVTFTVPKPNLSAMTLAPDRAWEYRVTIADPSIVQFVSESAEALTFRTLAKGSTQITIDFRKHLTNIGDKLTWTQTVAAGTTTSEITDGFDISNFSEKPLSVPVFADGQFEGVLSARYWLSSQNQAADAIVSCSLDDPGLVQTCNVSVESNGNTATMRFVIGPAVRSGRTTLHIYLQKGSASWTKDVAIVTYANKNRSVLDFDLELPAVIYTGDVLAPRLTGADAGIMDLSFEFMNQIWDTDTALVDVPAGYYPFSWYAQLKDLYYPGYNGSRYIDELAQGRTLSSDPLASWDEIRTVIEVRDRQQPQAETPMIVAWQPKASRGVYSSDIDRMEPQDKNYPWAEYPVNGFVRVPIQINGQSVTPVIQARLKNSADFPVPVQFDQYSSTNLYSMDIYTLYDFNYDVPKYDRHSWDPRECLWGFTVQLMIDNRQDIAPSTYTCTLQIDVTYPGTTLSTDVPVTIVVAKEAADILSRMPAIPQTAQVGDVVEELLQVEHVASVASDVYCSWSGPDDNPLIISWNGKCEAAGTAHWHVYARYINGEVTIAEGDITVQP